MSKQDIQAKGAWRTHGCVCDALADVHCPVCAVKEQLRLVKSWGGARSWPREAGTKSPASGGVTNTDSEKAKFGAETIAFDDYVANKGEAGAREAGKFRLEGKEYVVADGDVLHFRFAN